MIGIMQHRVAIGLHNCKPNTRIRNKLDSGPGTGPGNFLNQNHNSTRNFGFITYLYFIIMILSLTLSMAKTLKIDVFNLPSFHRNPSPFNDTALK